MSERSKPYPALTRARLKAGKAIANLEWVEEILRKEFRGLDLSEVPALREYAAIQRWKIDKVLPSLKAIEHTGSDGGPLEYRIHIGGH